MRHTTFRLSLLGGFSSLALVSAAAPALAQTVTAPPPSTPGTSAEGGEVEELVVTGSRTARRSALDTVAPVDVVSSETLSRQGTTELNQALSNTLPSFNFPRPSITDGTDSVRPATLRSLAPDQTLVLVNSKRRHSASLVNVNGSIGRGSAAVDLNAIPSAAVGSIEVLRDGAAAQYGSDAIAGVINLRLKERRDGGNVTTTYGQRDTDVETLPAALPAGATWAVNPNRHANDGAVWTISGWQGLPIGENGFLTVSAEYRDQENTIRAAPDTRQQYPLVGGAFDPRERTFDRVNGWFGDPKLQQYTLFANGGYDTNDGVSLYGWAGYQHRDSVSAAFFRRAIQQNVPPASASQNIISVYPNGFLPQIGARIDDYSGGIGLTFSAFSFDWDASVVFGLNDLDYTIRNTINATIAPTIIPGVGAVAPTRFYAGGLTYYQTVANLGGTKQIPVSFLAEPLGLALGVEYRDETFQINPGEPNSYIDGGFRPQAGAPAAPGAQGFPGFQPANATDKSRHSFSAYAEVEAKPTEALTLTGAVRGESYSDFGETVTGKLAARYDFGDAFALRGAVSTGFRAPSLQQQFFTATSTNFINGVPFQILTVPASSATARLLGATALEAEKSDNYSVGAVFRSGPFTLTADAYFIAIDDRIVLSENLTQANVVALLPTGISGVRFFTNGVDTETKGVDVVGTYNLVTDSIGRFDFTLGASFTDTEVTRLPTTNVLSALNPPPILFGRVNALTLSEGQPSSKGTFTTDWAMGPLGATVKVQYYGDVTSPGTTAAADIPLGDHVLLDLEGRFDIGRGLAAAVGAENVLDEYPDATPGALNSTGGTPFSSYSPFGFNGRYVYARLSYSW